MKIKNLKSEYVILVTVIAAFILMFFLSMEVKADEGEFKYGGGYAVTQQIEGVGYAAYVYDATNGLPTSDAMYLLGASEGYIWIGGYSGVIRYDGTIFERLSTSDGLTSARAFFEDSSNRIWVGTNDNGVVVLDGNKRTQITIFDGLPSSSIRHFAEDDNGNMIVGTTAGVCYIDKDFKVGRIAGDFMDTERILKLDKDVNGTIYGQTGNGIVFSIKDLAIDQIYTSSALGLGKITTILADPYSQGKIYYCTERGYIYHGTFGDRGNVLDRVSMASLGTPHWISFDCGRIWVASTSGIGYLDLDGELHELSGLPMDNAIEMMTSDYQGNMWFASSTQGIMKVVTDNFIDMTKADGIPEVAANAACYADGLLYIGSDEGLYILGEEENLIENEITRYLRNIRIRCIITDDDGNIWFATFNKNKGLVCLSYDGKITSFNAENGLEDNSVRCIYKTNDGRILAGTNSGLAIVSEGKVERTVGIENGITNTVFLSLIEGDDGKIYAGSDGGGLYIIDGDDIKCLGLEDGLTSEVVMRLKKDTKNDLIWIITSNSIEYMKDGKIKQVTSFPFNNNYDLHYDNHDNIWILSSYGIYRVKEKEMLEDNIQNYNLYTIANGLPYAVTTQEYSDRDEYGNLYVPGRKGVIRFNINNYFEKSEEIKIAVSSVYCDDTLIVPDEKGTYNLPASMGRITIHPSVMDYTMLNPTVHAFLEGSSDAGSYVQRSELSSLEYTGLSYGNHTLHIQILNNEDNVAHDETFLLVRKPLLYELLTFRIFLMILMAGVTGYVVWRIMTATVITRQYDEIRLAKDEAERANTAKSTFLANMSHEIRTPINTIMGMDEMIIREDVTDVPKGYYHSIRGYATDIRNATESLLGLINDLLDMSKIESGKMHLVELEYDVQELLRSIVSMIRVRSTEKELIFEVVVDEVMPSKLYGDAGKIKQVVLNLLTNAVKYTEKGGFALNVSMEARENDTCELRFSVKDTGIGVREEDMEKLFTAYERLDEKKNSGIQGTGLGLDISRRFAELMGGNLWCESVYGEGSEFILTVHQKIVDPTPLGVFIEHDISNKGSYVPQFIAPDADVLVVDDTPMNLNVIKGLLKPTKIFVTTADSGEEAIEKIKETKFNVVLLDHMMPGMDGIETLARIRADYPDLPVYALTANSTAGEEFYTSKGFNGYLSKPVDSEILESTILKHLPPEMVMKKEDDEESKELTELPEDMLWINDAEGISVEEGIRNSGGVSGFMYSLKLFLDTIDTNIDVISNAFENDDIRLYTIKVHALKSSARIVGAMELSKFAASLEEAGNLGDRDYIQKNTGKLILDYRAYKDILARLEEESEAQADSENLQEISEEDLKGAYEALKDSIATMDYDAIEMILDQLKEYRLPEAAEETIKELRNLHKTFDWDGMEELFADK